MKKQTKLGLVLAAAAVISVSVASLVSARGWVQNGADWFYVDNNNEYITDTIQSSGNAKFYLGENGAMQRDYFLEDYNGNAYYFGQNGAMVTNTWVAIESSRVENQDDYVPDNYWYYFQSSGKAMKAASGKIKKTTIDGKKYGFNEYGQMCTGWVTSDGKVINPDDDTNPFTTATYYAGGDNDGVLRAGWVTYYDGYDGDSDYQSDKTNLYFYFNTSNNEKYANDTKKINGRTYAFDDDGIMLSGWDVYDYNLISSKMGGKTSYFSGDDDGHQVKKGWVYAVPSGSIDSGKHDDDEEVYMYFNASGEIIRDQIKKINGKNYVFNRTGVMKTGLVIWAPDTLEEKYYDADSNAWYSWNVNPDATPRTNGRRYYKYVDKLDLDWATGEEVSKKGILRFGDAANDYFQVNMYGQVINTVGAPTVPVSTGAPTGYVKKLEIPNLAQLKLHLFGDDGARKTGSNNVEFADDTFTFYSSSAGDKGSGSFSKKYYSLGIQCKANADIRYGIYNTASPADVTTVPGYGEPLGPQAPKEDGVNANADWYRRNLVNGTYIVLTTGGAKQKGNNTAKKDADGNYWLIDRGSSTLKGIWTQNVKVGNTINAGFTTRTARIDGVMPFANESTYRTSTISALIGGGNYWDIQEAVTEAQNDANKFMRSDVNNTLNGITWKAFTNNTANTVYFVSQNAYTGYCYQSDIAEGSNKWIPFGVFDNAGKTVIENPRTYADKAELHAYEVIPNNDYFTNCYWN